jgi:hypothetical protein
MAVWLGTIAAIILLWLVASILRTPQFAMGLVVLSLTLVPSWCSAEFLRLPFFAHIAGTIFCLGMYCLHPKATFPIKLGIIDYCALSFLAIHVVSDTLIEGWSWVYLLRAYGEWAVPYLAGRLAFQRWSDVEQLVPFGVGAATILGLNSIFESISGIHPFEWLHGERPYENMARDTTRWGLYRAWGTRAHPIYFGTIQLMLMPWTAYAAVKAIRNQWSIGWVAALLINIVGILATGSRAPVVAVPLAMFVGIFFTIPKARVPLSVLALGFSVALIIFMPTVEALLKKSEKTEITKKHSVKIVLDEEQVEYSSYMSRWYAFKLYFPAAVRGGLFGHGTTATRDFPPQVGIRIEDQKTMKYLRFVDNSYLLVALRFGLVGFLLFTVIAISSLVRIFVRANQPGPDSALLALCTASCMAALLVVIGTVWLAPDYQFHLFALFGLCSVPNIFSDSQPKRQSLDRTRPSLAERN